MEKRPDSASPESFEGRARQLAEEAFTKYFEEECRTLEDKIFKQSMLALIFLAVVFSIFSVDFTFSIIVLLCGVVVCSGMLMHYPQWKVRRDFYSQFPEHARWLKKPPSGK